MSAEVIGGRYHVERLIGRGGMATVHLARDEQLARMVVVKCLSEALTGDEVFRERFAREARIAGQLAHPNIVSVFDVGEDDGLPYIVMEYVEGQTVADLIAHAGPIEPDRAVDLVLQVCAGLEHAHRAGLVHRDIKPQNLLVRPDDTVKIADFGIARPVDATQLTLTGTILGSAAYLAPEQAVGDPVTGAADIYSVGAVLYELLAGRPPYAFQSLPELTLKQRQGPPPRIDGVQRPLEEVVLRCLAYDPEARPASAAALARELADVSHEIPTEPIAASATTAVTEVLAPRRPVVHVSRRAQVVIAALLGAGALVGGLLVGIGVGDDSSPPPARPARQDVIPRGNSPAESARNLADWLRARAG